MHVPRAFVQQSQFQTAIAQVAQGLAPEVVGIVPTLGDDWSGEPAVFFMVILADSFTRQDRLLNMINHVSEAVEQQIQPLEQWGVLPYFNFRSQSEQARFNEPALV